ncbi:uncharacterized protein LOC118194199 [Stegodyphus dumicola]|uniref:uncharacterized protein LOC118194199 n=1 Tax=Stegodyphus dumicola TaxID=202533 RepID=UPI0015AD3A4A|nr:uncharacterized protein LOC118194199 [Stegodyphus dumicola]
MNSLSATNANNNTPVIQSNNNNNHMQILSPHTIPPSSRNIGTLSTSIIKCLQINLQRAEAATSHVLTQVISNDIDLVIMQEPYCREGHVASLPIAWKIYQKESPTADLAPRVAIACLLQPRMDTPQVIKLLHRDYVAILIIFENMQFILTSVYSPPTDAIGSTVAHISETSRKFPNTAQVIGGDFNAHHIIWGYSTTNPKGQELEDYYIAANNLQLHNTTNAPPTFDNSYNQGWPDLTISTYDIANNIHSWHVSDSESCSDHKYVEFTIQTDTTISIIKRYRLPGNKVRQLTQAFTRLLQAKELQLESCNNSEHLDSLAQGLLEELNEICQQILPLRTTKKLQGISWWTGELRQQRQKCRALRRRLRG